MKGGIIMKEHYDELEAEVIYFDEVDVITSSSGGGGGTILPPG